MILPQIEFEPKTSWFSIDFIDHEATHLGHKQVVHSNSNWNQNDLSGQAIKPIALLLLVIITSNSYSSAIDCNDIGAWVGQQVGFKGRFHSKRSKLFQILVRRKLKCWDPVVASILPEQPNSWQCVDMHLQLRHWKCQCCNYFFPYKPVIKWKFD